MSQISARGNIPLLVGGTMLYVKALLDGLSPLPPADTGVRETLAARAQQVGWPAMHAELSRIDPITAARLKPTDAQRIQRALEVFTITGTPLSALQTRATTANDFPYRTLQIGLVAEQRSLLHERIATRFDAMLKAGVIEEMQTLRARYELSAEMPSMRCVGYRQAWAFLDGEIDEKTLRDTGIAATRQLAKRQLTWLRSMPNAEPMDCLHAELQNMIVARIEKFLAQA